MSSSSINPFEQAGKHPIVCDKPAVNFFEGALLGNGGLGAVVTTRPDGIMIHFGHNNVWDIRVAEDNVEKIGTFKEIFEKVKTIPSEYDSLDQDDWYRDYVKMTEANYRKPYPRPFPCGSFLIGFDRRRAELIGHRLDISTGLCEVEFLVDKVSLTLQIFTDMNADRLWLRLVDDEGKPANLPFERVRLIPDPETPEEIPPFTVPDDIGDDCLSFRQVLPFQETGGLHPKDRAFRLTARLSPALERRSRINWAGVSEEMGDLERGLVAAPEFVACVGLDEGLSSELSQDGGDLPLPTNEAFETALAASREVWEDYWSKSGVRLDDQFLEGVWYRNLYFLNCAVKPGATPPGLWANWSYKNIGSAWHGDYHMNYNTQQPFWLTFSSNHVDKHIPYVDLVYHLLPISCKWARDYYGLRGAYFPHSAYPIEMNVMPYPVPTWGWEICETPWTVQSLWWHYLYTMDKGFLEERAFEPVREAVLFLVDYMLRPEAHGEGWDDDAYHIFPTVSPELYGLRPGFEKNHDCLVDLTLTKFVFKAYLEACTALGWEEKEGGLIGEVREVLGHFPEYPTASSERGKVFVSVPGEDTEVVYNVPNSTMTVFPGEEHGLGSPPEEYEIAANSYLNQRNEGGNELVFLNLQGARLGLLDLERFKRQIAYCLLPNGTCTDMVLQVHGRYRDTGSYDFMASMGVWLENFALPLVVNECLLQSYDGTLRFFPNWPADEGAEFRTLRAAGAFLVSASFEGGEVEWIEITSEAGMPLRAIIPWESGAKYVREDGEGEIREKLLIVDTTPGETIRLIKR